MESNEFCTSNLPHGNGHFILDIFKWLYSAIFNTRHVLNKYYKSNIIDIIVRLLSNVYNSSVRGHAISHCA